MQCMKFAQFLEMKFVEWQQKEGGRRSVADFAQWIGIKQSTLSMWWNSGVAPSGESVKLLSLKLGLEVYDVLGLPRPDEDMHALQQIWDRLPPELRRSLREQGEQYDVKHDTKRTHKSRRTSSS